MTLHALSAPAKAAVTASPSAPAPSGPAGKPGPVSARVRVLDHAAATRAGVDGVLFTLSGSAVGGGVKVSLGYGGFARAAGADFGARLRLIRLPECVLRTPDRPECRVATPLAGRNNSETKTVTAAASGGADSTVVLAAETSASGDAGDYRAAPLSAASAWSTSLNSGSFSWKYDMTVPAVPGGLVPNVGLSYSSGSVDGRTSNGNNQASWAGDGFDIDPGFVERSYKSCGDDGIQIKGVDSGDLCWAYDNETISFNGHSGQLVPVSADEWRIRGDDGTKVVRVRDTSRGNGDNDGEYFVATISNGTKYYFGYNRLPNWASGDPETRSVETAPVFGDDSGEPCHSSTFADSWCQQGWRWNLDLVVDPNGNDITYWYTPHTNYYGRTMDASKGTPYTRGTTLDHIEYGQRKPDIYSSTVKPMARVDFTTAERCLESTASLCDAAGIDTNKQYWYDTPWDMNCKSGASCDNLYSPTFWIRTRLTKVTTQALQPDGSYKDIDAWDLHHHWGTADNDYQLLLDSIRHTALASGTPITLPATTLGYTTLQNRLDKTGDGLAPFLKQRLSSIDDESGGQVDVNYSGFACDWNSLPAPQSNTTHCFPQMYQPTNDVPVTTQWFSKYVVDSVISTDRTGGAPDMVTKYFYLDGGAWAFDDDDGLTKEKLKTWSQWRGHAHVRVETGGTASMSTQTDHYFLRGMDGDRSDPSDPSKTRTVTVADGEGGTLTDDEAWAGFEYRTETYDKPGGKILEKSVNTPWKKQTASLARSWGTITANLTGTATKRSFTSLDQGAGSQWRQVRTNTVYDDRGRATRVEALGDVGVTTDDRCTRTTYADNTGAWILTGAIRTETVAGNCSANPDLDTRADGTSAVISDVRVRYDGQSYGEAPIRGLATLTETLKSRQGTSATYLDDAATYDAYGRPLTKTIDASTSVFDPTDDSAPPVTKAGPSRTTSTAYTPATGRPAKVVVTGPPATAGNSATAQTTTTYFDALRGLPVVTIDPTGRRTDVSYDALARVTGVWKPDRSRSGGQSPDLAFVYHDADGAIRSVETRTLNNNGSQDAAYTLYDGFGRVRQTQAPGQDGGRILTDTFYDERGLAALAYAPYYATGAPSGTLSTVENATGLETQTAQKFDGLGRVVQSTVASGNGAAINTLSTTITSYGGDRVTVTPPQGATPTTTITDAQGRTTELRQYRSDTPTGDYDTTTYGYDPAGHLNKLTGPAGNVWTWTYDQLGHQVKAVDPDTGTTTKKYDDRGELVSTTDGRGRTITHVYDNLSRELQTHDGTASGPLLTSQTWDPANNKGRPGSQTRYATIDGTTYRYTTTINAYDALYRPTRTTLTVPSVPGQTAPYGGGTGLAGDHVTQSAYNLDGTLQSVSYPAAGGLPAETVSYTYDGLHRVKSIGSNLSTYLTDQTYSLTGQPLQSTLNAGGGDIWITDAYYWGWRRLRSSTTQQYDVTGPDRAPTYTYDPAGNILSISDTARTGTDTQCFRYDHLARLTEAFTPAGTDCPSTPDGASLGGPAPYWSSYTYNTDGTRRSEVRHDTSGNTVGDITRTYGYPATGGGPHSLKDVATAVGAGDPVDETYGYDGAGNTTTRHLVPGPDVTDDESLTWGATDTLDKATDTIATATGNGTVTTTRTTGYVYDPLGTRLTEHVLDTARPAAENTTLYLGNSELNLVKGATAPTATRYYDLGSATAIRTNDNKVTFQPTDPHGTSDTNIDAATGAVTQHYETPFGADRGAAPTIWAGTRGFLGGAKDTGTGLTRLGARDYDPATGRFITADPLLTPDDPQSLAAYTYGDNNPITRSDPTGLRVEECSTGALDCSGDNHHINDQDEQTERDQTCITPGVDCNSPYLDQTSPVSTTQSATVEVYPTVTVPRNWAKRIAFQNALWDRIHKDCDYQHDWDCDDPGEYVGPNAVYPADGVKSASQRLTTDVFLACSDIGGCPEKLHLGNLSDVLAANVKALFDPHEVAGMGDMFGTGPKAPSARRNKGADEPLACSFTPTTKVLMADGTTKPIGKIKPGDKVEAADPGTGEHQGPRTVDATIADHDDDLVDLTVQTGKHRTATIHTTADHPFWDDTVHGWVPAAHLERAHTLTGHVSVIAVHDRPGAADMYNLTVRQLHTYYVDAGTTPVLVHNSGCLPTPAEAQDLVKAAKPVGSALKSDAWHRSASFAVDDIADNGRVFSITGGDGVKRILIQTPGEVNGVSGRFEWILDGDRLTHQMFVRGGTINGIPIKP